MHKKRYWFRFGVLLLCIYFIYQNGIEGTFWIDRAHAQVDPDIFGNTLDNISEFMSMVISAASVVNWIAFSFLSFLLNPDFVFDMDASNPSGNQGVLKLVHSIWMFSRDVVNMIFVVVLILVAMYMVITARRDFLKAYLPKFVAAVVLVNFSWFGIKVMYDVSNVVAATVFDLPVLIYQDKPFEFCDDIDGSKQPIKKPYQALIDMEFFPEGKNNIEHLENSHNMDCSLGFVCYRLGEMAEVDRYAGHAVILNGLVVNHGHLLEHGLVPPGGDSDNWQQNLIFLIKQALILMMVVGFAFPMAAMVVAFLIRIPMLWMTMGFIPFAFLSLVGGEKVSQLTGGKGPRAIWDTFLQFAFLPAICGIALGAGFIMINAGANYECELTGSGPPSDFGGPGGVAFRLLDTISTPWQFLWLIAAGLVMWMGVFGALKSNAIVGMFTGQIEGIGKALGGLAWRAPLSMPLPFAGGKTALNIAKAHDPRRLLQDLKNHGSLPALRENYEERLKEGKAKSDAPAGAAQTAINNIGGSRTGPTSLGLAVTGFNATQNDATFSKLVQEIQKLSNNTNVNEKNIVNVLREMRTADDASLTKLQAIGIADESAFNGLITKIENHTGP
jgi:hypothetical protein